jgi:hypothetical protein
MGRISQEAECRDDLVMKASTLPKEKGKLLRDLEIACQMELPKCQYPTISPEVSSYRLAYFCNLIFKY